MPAETHQQRDVVTVEEIVDLLVAVLATSTDPGDVGPEALLADFGVDSEIALFDLGIVVAEEYGERGLAEIDVDDLGSAKTIGALATLFARQRAGAGQHGDFARWEDPT